MQDEISINKSQWDALSAAEQQSVVELHREHKLLSPQGTITGDETIPAVSEFVGADTSRSTECEVACGVAAGAAAAACSLLAPVAAAACVAVAAEGYASCVSYCDS